MPPNPSGWWRHELKISCFIVRRACVCWERAPSIASSTEMRGNWAHHGATDCTGIHVDAARGIWKRKTAEHWATAAGVEVRAAKYWLATRKVSDAGKLAIIRLLA